MKNKTSFCRRMLYMACPMVLLACGKKDTSGDDTKQPPAVVTVQASTVTTGNVPEQIVVTGHTEALAQEKIVAPIDGRLLSLTGIEGSPVKAGEVIGSIQSKEAQASQEGGRAMLAEAKTPAERAQAERAIALAGDAQNGVEVRARISGLIASRSANPGEFVSQDEELLSIISESDIEFVADVPLFYMPRIRIGEHAAITLPTLSGKRATLEGTVVAIKPQADSSSQAGKVVFQFQKIPAPLASALRTGIAGTATITFDVKHHAMLVPKSAVLRDDETNEQTVMTFGPDSIAHSVNVQTGPELDSLVSIQSDALKPGMNIITSGNYALADSTRITLTRSNHE